MLKIGVQCCNCWRLDSKYFELEKFCNFEELHDEFLEWIEARGWRKYDNAPESEVERMLCSHCAGVESEEEWKD